MLSPVHSRYIVTSASYLTQLETLNHQNAFSLVQCHALPSTVFDGTYKNVPLAERLSSSDSVEVETTKQTLHL